MAERKFKIGDVVQIISGSPKMTVTEHCLWDAEQYEVTWFEGTSLHRQTVSERALALAA